VNLSAFVGWISDSVIQQDRAILLGYAALTQPTILNRSVYSVVPKKTKTGNAELRRESAESRRGKTKKLCSSLRILRALCVTKKCKKGGGMGNY